MNVGFQLRKLIKFNIISLAKRTAVSQGEVKKGTIISPFLSCGTAFNKNEFIKTGTSCLICDTNIYLFSDNISNLSIKDGILRSSIAEPGPVTKTYVGLPFIDLVTKDLKLPSIRESEVIDPSPNVVVEKKARKSLIRIRRKKIKLHKRKKLKKRMKFVFAKIKKRRKAKREKEFMKLISSILDSGETYDPETELNENLKVLKWKEPVTRIRGFLAPKSIVEDYLKEKEIRALINKRVEECLKKL